MALTLYYHPLSSFCQKVLVAFYETGIAFTPQLVDLQDADEAAALRRLWPIGKFPVVHDSARDVVVPESTMIIEHLALHHGATALLPDDPQQAFATRHWDRYCDLYLELPMQKAMLDNLRPEDSRDPYGVAQAREQLRTAYGVLDAALAARKNASWLAGEHFSMADCAALPGLFYAEMVVPFASEHPALAAYWARLLDRASVVRVLREAQPYLANVPV